MIWLDQIDESYFDFSHAVLLLDGKFYDSQHPTGVSSPDELALVREITRDDFIRNKD